MNRLADSLDASYIDLAAKDISYYDYEHKNVDDDFIHIAEQMVSADLMILGTPVYWYTMSAQMKTFLDRWSDLVTVRKDLGRAMKGKGLMLISCGSENLPVKYFEQPFELTAGYMDMDFKGYFATWIGDHEDFEMPQVKGRIDALSVLIKGRIE